jgi:predicted transcriptional regulator
MSNVCRLCRHDDPELVRRLFARNLSDRQIAQQLGVSHSAVSRHRRAHIAPLVKAAAIALDRGRAIHERREQQLAAIQQGDTIAAVLAAFGLAPQLEKIANIERRLERVIENAENAGSAASVAQIASQQLRSVEVGSRLAQTGGYKPASAIPQAGERPTISIEMVFSAAGRTETITLADRPVLDGDLVEPPVPGEQVPDPVPHQKFQGDIADYWDSSPRREGTGKDDSDQEG